MISVGNSMRISHYIIVCLILSQICSPSAYADQENEVVIKITLEHHVFSPSEIHVPAHKKIILIIHNLDSTIEEFDSPALKREKILRSGSETKIILAPLQAGKYDFVGEFYQDTAKGAVIVED